MQYNNVANMEAHYSSTGPEIWRQTDGKITHFVAGMGTGGTISGIGKYLKEKNPKCTIVGVDPEGSVYLDYFKTGKMVQPHVYKVEGIGEDMLCGALDPSEKVHLIGIEHDRELDVEEAVERVACTLLIERGLVVVRFIEERVQRRAESAQNEVALFLQRRFELRELLGERQAHQPNRPVT